MNKGRLYPARFLGKREGITIVTAALLAAFVSVAADSQVVASPEEFEAAYVHRFLSYVEWPPRVFPTAASAIVVGVAGLDRMFELVSAIAGGRPVQGRPVEVRRLLKPEPNSNVHLVFVGRGAWKDLPAWAAISKRASDGGRDVPHRALTTAQWWPSCKTGTAFDSRPPCQPQRSPE